MQKYDGGRQELNYSILILYRPRFIPLDTFNNIMTDHLNRSYFVHATITEKPVIKINSEKYKSGLNLISSKHESRWWSRVPQLVHRLG
jgi:hypothetical protein